MDEVVKVLLDDFGLEDILDKKSIDLLAENIKVMKLSKDQIIQRDNNECKGVPFVISGSLRFFRSAENGREMNIYRVKKGQLCILAALCILTDKPYDFMVSAEEETVLCIVNSSVFKELVEKNKQFNKFILEMLSEKLIHTLTLHEKIHLTGVEDKLLDYIYTNAIDGEVLKTHQSIAEDLGTSRVVVSRAIAKLRDDEIVTTSRNKIVLIKK